MDGVARLDLVRGKSVLILHDATGVNEALLLFGDVCELLGGELRLQVQNGDRVGHCDGVGLFTRGLHLEGDHGLAAAFCVVGHGSCMEAVVDEARLLAWVVTSRGRWEVSRKVMAGYSEGFRCRRDRRPFGARGGLKVRGSVVETERNAWK